MLLYNNANVSCLLCRWQDTALISNVSTEAAEHGTLSFYFNFLLVVKTYRTYTTSLASIVDSV
jgi:hypothetical protein